MIEEQAVIIAIESSEVDGNTPVNNQAGNIATLEIMRQAPCGICGQTRGCGNSLWGKIFAHKSSTFKAKNFINAQVGDGVIVGIDEQVVLKGALLLYALPLATMMIGALLSTSIFAKTPSQGDLYAVIGAVIGLTLGFVWVKGHTASRKYSAQNQPVILRLAGQIISQCNAKN